MKISKLFLSMSLLFSFHNETYAQSSDFCEKISSITERMLSSPDSFHGNDKEENQGIFQSTSKIMLPSAEQCRFVTSSVNRDDIKFKTADLECDWPQNGNSSSEDALKVAEDMGKGISECMKGRKGVKNYFYDKETRKEWLTTAKDGKVKVSYKTTSLKKSKYPKVTMTISAQRDE